MKEEEGGVWGEGIVIRVRADRVVWEVRRAPAEGHSPREGEV